MERKVVTEALRKLEITGPEARYNLEYSTAAELAMLTGVECRFTGTYYWFDTPVLEEDFLRGIINPSEKILDVGAGNGTLLKKLIKRSLFPSQLVGVDISRKAVERIRETGARVFHGTISAVKDGEFGTIFLSYFVDRDSDQRGTFVKSAEILIPGGLVILEGCFPCELTSPAGFKNGVANVTQGRDAEEDIQLVIAEFAKLGLTLKDRWDGQRFVYSLDGPEILPSTIFVNLEKIFPFLEFRTFLLTWLVLIIYFRRKITKIR